MVHEETEQGSSGERKQFFYELQCKSNTLSESQVNNLTGVRDSAKHPTYVFKQAARVKLVKIWFAAGAQNYVHVIGKLNDHQVIPSPDTNFDTGGVIGDDETFPFFLNKVVKAGDKLSFFYRNTDASNDHTVGIYVEVEFLASKRRRIVEVAVREPIPEPPAEEEPTVVEDETQAAYRREVIPNPDDLIDGLEHE
jgi:hypothetical protein